MSFAVRSAGDLAERIGAVLEGDPGVQLRGVAGLAEAEEGDLSFLANEKYASALPETGASAVILGPGVDGAPCTVLRVQNPDLAFAEAVREMAPPPPRLAEGVSGRASVSPDATLGTGVAVGPNAVVEAGARIGDRVQVGAGCHLGEGAEIGPDSVLHPNAVVSHRCRVGARVIVHPGAVIGADGFGYVWDGTQHVKVPQVGDVVVEDDVEIGANTTIDRGRFGSTVVGRGTKLDNLIQVAHNVRIGPHCAFAAQVGVAGSTQFGAGCLAGGQAGILGHINVGDGASISATAWVTKDIPAGERFTGSPAGPHGRTLNDWRHVKALGRLRRTVREMQRRIEHLEAETDHTG
jgi:UDP-3-O-[3-hydroxymyristoyl] glucosamine N-acyltransferase